MKFFAATNTVTQTVAPCLPWEFKGTENITAQIRQVKEDRQNWYKNPATQHNFYSGLEAANPNARVSKENPPRLLHAFVADYDVPVPKERVLEAIAAMENPPTWFEKSLGGNFRLVWCLETPILVEDTAFCIFILQRAKEWLSLDVLPGLDAPAFEVATRLYCNGLEWENVGKPIPANKVQAFFVDAGRKFRFKVGDDEQVPLDVVEKAIRAKFPNFDWPGPFDPETQGPSFWIEGSQSTQSAILKAGGLFTFAAHAAKPFYSWSDLLGSDFTQKFNDEAIAKATADIWWDGKRFWKRKAGVYLSLDRTELTSYFRVTCRLSAKPGSTGNSPIDLAFDHIFSHQWVIGAGPFVFRESGLVTYQNERKLNTYSGKALDPAAGVQLWGPTGNFPFTCKLFDTIFNPIPQLPYFLAALKHYYTSAFEKDPHPGQNYVLMGGAGIGKTLLNRSYVGVAVGGYVDASDFLVDGGTFTSHLFRSPHWALDDDNPSNSAASQTRLHALFKKLAANQQFLCNEKFERASMIEWMGRIGCTTNLDYVSTRIVGPLDNSSLDKMNLFKCVAKAPFEFPSRTELQKTITAELPFFLRWLLDWSPPDHIKRNPRFGYDSYQEKSLLDQTYQTSPSASFQEIWLEALLHFFKSNPAEKTWSGTITAMVREIMVVPGNDVMLKSLRLEQSNRFLEQIQREGLVKCEASTGALNSRIWTFHRPESQ